MFKPNKRLPNKCLPNECLYFSEQMFAEQMFAEQMFAFFRTNVHITFAPIFICINSKTFDFAVILSI